ncbi:DNA repair protein RecO [Motiliproteus sediminis]|uniref:DNA repair protein RecO n=1 Tax=Motiliproteus sediminis TaxID=1468178 RepID=UPI001AEF890C|nr:DNA repair protein RecO [Motiliproteus sediminis]
MTSSADSVLGQNAYLLHSRPYRETSALIDLLTPEFGRVRGVLKGVRQPRSRKRELLRSFQPLSVSWRGRGELKTIQDGEGVGLAHPLAGRSLWCGLYLNELLVRLLPADEPYPRVFALYRFSLEQLGDLETEEAVLRMFEVRLLEELGFGVSFTHDLAGMPIDPAQQYCFDPAAGFNPLPAGDATGAIPGAVIMAVGGDDYADPQVRRVAKGLMRRALAVHLGGRPLRSRSLFQTSALAAVPEQRLGSGGGAPEELS